MISPNSQSPKTQTPKKNLKNLRQYSKNRNLSQSSIEGQHNLKDSPADINQYLEDTLIKLSVFTNELDRLQLSDNSLMYSQTINPKIIEEKYIQTIEEIRKLKGLIEEKEAEIKTIPSYNKKVSDSTNFLERLNSENSKSVKVSLDLNLIDTEGIYSKLSKSQKKSSRTG